MWKGALFQLSSTEDPKENLETINEMINTAAAKNEMGRASCRERVCGSV